ncbi:Leucine--tRNA ligase [Candidatus Providencia siddallii]|uniref:Leucine--tRNA ligase n=1 Tax=Candidatus Providencia siddallii TaxID=1715285 RepID=A0A0M6W7Z9_9GAMM|nr:Leucine--tRNA ligase [Candidatus Providencia siddallii]
MQEEYNSKNIEPKIQSYWEKNKIFKVNEDNNKEKYYCLSMIPYPSGKLHMGHVRNYTIGDVISRYQRMLGKNVLQPIGWDAFGLPAENAAIKNNTNPSTWTYSNIEYMKNQLKILGLSYDWDREITTCTPEYYHWEQWFFIKLYEKKLAYKKISLVNWCPHDLTVLANEQVINNRCWNCNTTVEHKEISQWFIKITSYAEELLNDLNLLEGWPEQVKRMQRNWIGRSEGVEIQFKIMNTNKYIIIYTKYLNILMGVTYIIIAADNPLSKEVSVNNYKIIEFINKCKKNKNTEADIAKINKNGISTGMYVIHPLTKEKLPIWIVNFISMNYNNGVDIAIPAHNQRDLEFAKKYKLPIRKVITCIENNKTNLLEKTITRKKILINSGEFNGLDDKKASNLILKKLITLGIGKYKIKYRLRDWCVSRQRFWGAPIPMATIKNGDIIPIPENQLPVLLPENIKNNHIWKQISINNKEAIRETDTFDTFIESSWYYARYACPNYNQAMLNTTATNYWLPVDQYIGGVEHATMHLMYFRFFHKLMRDAGIIKFNEPVKRLLCQGMVLSNAFYYIGNNGQRVWVSKENTFIERDNKNNIIKAIDNNGNELIYAGMIKMSKSKNNGVNPETIIKKYGADTLRLSIMFAAPPESSLEWHESNIEGANRFIHKIWRLVYNHLQKKPTHILNLNNLTLEQKKLRYFLHKTISKVTDDIGRRYAFNTAIAEIMKFTNKLSLAPQNTDQDRGLIQESLEAIILMLSPIIPHVCFKLWRILGHKKDIDFAKWPTVDNKAIICNSKLIIVQVNGKTRGCIKINANLNKTSVFEIAKKEYNIAKHINKGIISNIIYIPDKILNIIIN